MRQALDDLAEGFDSTYEGLKPRTGDDGRRGSGSFDSTYEGLKPLDLV